MKKFISLCFVFISFAFFIYFLLPHLENAYAQNCGDEIECNDDAACGSGRRCDKSTVCADAVCGGCTRQLKRNRCVSGSGGPNCPNYSCTGNHQFCQDVLYDGTCAANGLGDATNCSTGYGAGAANPRCRCNECTNQCNAGGLGQSSCNAISGCQWSDTCSYPTATPEPTEAPEPTTPPGQATPTPFIRAVIRNKNGVKVKVGKVCRAVCDANTTACSQSLCLNDVSAASFSKTTGVAKQGAKIKLQTEAGSRLIIVGVTPSVNGGLANPCPGPSGGCYTWNTNSWTGGSRKVTFIVATPTPLTPTATTTPTGALTPTPSPTSTPTLTPTSIPPTATPVPGCLCKTDNTCDALCAFEKYSDATYANPIRCDRESSIIGPTPAAAQKTLYCQRNIRTKGDVDGDGVITYNKDYFYYVAAVNGGGIPDIANADVNGDGTVSPNDRAIIIRSLPQ